jgi:hypothetical protein
MFVYRVKVPLGDASWLGLKEPSFASDAEYFVFKYFSRLPTIDIIISAGESILFGEPMLESACRCGEGKAYTCKTESSDSS